MAADWDRSVNGTRVTISRGASPAGLPGIFRSLAALCCVALLAPVVAPLPASKLPAGLTILLDPPKPYTAEPEQFFLDTTRPMPLTGGPANSTPSILAGGSAALPFHASGSAQDRLRASLCLTAAIYYEAGQEPDAGQQAVAQVVLNRLRHPAYPNTVCGVVYQGTERNDALCQFTFGCDGSLVRGPMTASWSRAWRNAQAALSGAVYAPVGLSTHYHTLAVKPVWSRRLTPTAIVGAHIFYRWPGGAGELRAFHDVYQGSEPVPAPRPRQVAAAQPPSPGSAVLANPVRGVPPDRLEPSLIANDTLGDARYVPGSLPASEVRDKYRASGTWKQQKGAASKSRPL